MALILPAANKCFYWFIVVFAGGVTAKYFIFLLVAVLCWRRVERMDWRMVVSALDERRCSANDVT